VADQVPSGGLTPVEQSLVEHACRGEWLDLAGDDEVVDEAAMRSWGDDRTCRATVIRDILRGLLPPDFDPHVLRLRGARVSGQLDLDYLSTVVSLELRDCLLEDGVLARDARLASVILAGCRIGQRAGPPLNAARLTCNALRLTRARIIGHAEDGVVNLAGGRVGQLDCSGAQLRNDSGPALAADGLQVDQELILTGGFTATGSGGDGAVRLLGARVGGYLGCSGAQLRNDSGPALSANGLQVDQELVLTGGFTATGGGNGAAVNLIRARVGGTLFFDSASLEHAAIRHRRLAVDGLTYAGVPQRISAEGWLDLLRDGTPRYAAQPYQQLAAGYRALGDERQSREILMAQRDDELARGDTRWPERLWGWITKVTLGYGYQPWRALWFLAAVVVVSCVLAVVLGAHGALAQTSKTATPGRSCTVVQQVSVGLDLNLPVGTSVARADCDLTKNSASATAAWLSAVGWVLRLAAWVFAALFIAGFTSAVRKT
jgi:hypothetical protein